MGRDSNRLRWMWRFCQRCDAYDGAVAQYLAGGPSDEMGGGIMQDMVTNKPTNWLRHSYPEAAEGKGNMERGGWVVGALPAEH